MHLSNQGLLVILIVGVIAGWLAGKRRRSSPPEAERPGFASLTAAPNAERRRHKNGFFNGIDPKRPFEIGSVNGQ
jgi:hypothetical protein